MLLVSRMIGMPFVNHWISRLCVIGCKSAMVKGTACAPEIVRFVEEGEKLSIGWMAA